MNERYLGIDIGGTAVKLGVVTHEGNVLSTAEESVCFDRYQTPILTTVVQAAKAFAADHNFPFSGVGVSATGQIDSHRGVVAGTCGSLPGWSGSPIVATLHDALSLPVTVANDANCMCLGEAWVGAAKGCNDVIGITIGTGLGGGILCGGKLLEGARGLGGELGHMATHAVDGEPCPCGNIGCWERYASTTALVRQTMKHDVALTDGRAVFAAAKTSPVIQALLSAWIREIAVGLCGLVHIFNPERIIIGGGVSNEQEMLIEPLEKQTKALLMPAFAEGLTLRAATLRNRAGLVGAVKYHLDHMA